MEQETHAELAGLAALARTQEGPPGWLEACPDASTRFVRQALDRLSERGVEFQVPQAYDVYALVIYAAVSGRRELSRQAEVNRHLRSAYGGVGRSTYKRAAQELEEHGLIRGIHRHEPVRDNYLELTEEHARLVGLC